MMRGLTLSSHDVAGPSFRNMPAYLKQIQYKCPTDIANGPFQYAHSTKLPFFAWLGENPSYLECFNNYMSGYRAGKPSWADPGCYPIEERLACEKTSSDEVLIVDIGGGMGHDLQELKEKHPSVRGRLILQDRREVIDQIPKDKKAFEPTVHDFFTSQPIKGNYELEPVSVFANTGTKAPKHTICILFSMTGMTRAALRSFGISSQLFDRAIRKFSSTTS